jgi:hypothetical protein
MGWFRNILRRLAEPPAPRPPPAAIKAATVPSPARRVRFVFDAAMAEQRERDRIAAEIYANRGGKLDGIPPEYRRQR